MADTAARKAKEAGAERTDLYEEFKRPQQPGDKPKPRGLNAQGYKFPPEPPGSSALTKEHLAKGVSFDRAAPTDGPAPELKDQNAMFETYERPDLDHHPRTGSGLRGEPPRTAKEILADYQPPEPQVFTSKRERTPPPAADTVESDAAHLDAEADLAATQGATMSHSRSHGPSKTITQHDPFREMPSMQTRGPPAAATSKATAPPPATPATPAAARAMPPTATPSPTRPTPPQAARSASGPSSPHAPDGPALTPGDGPRIGIVQSDYHFDLTTRMADLAKTTAATYGAKITHHVHVPGVYDVPLMAKALSKRSDVDALVVVGCVLQGETGHDELIARECARKLADLAYDSEKPVGLAVTGPRMTLAAAQARVSTARYAVESVIKQWRALKALGAARMIGS